MMDNSPLPPSDLWAITGYFNPIGYRRRRLNYRAFRRHLNVPLLTVELGYRDRFELERDDATRLIRVRCDHILWQKERLLNLAVAQLPPSCRKVVLLDCDILFARPDWAGRAAAAVEQFAMAQLFSRIIYLPEVVDFDRPLAEQGYLQRRSTASGLVGGKLATNALGAPSDAARRHGLASDFANGHAWVMRREVIEDAGLYDGMIVGGGDYNILQAAIGEFEVVRNGHDMQSRHFQHFLSWAEKFHRTVNGDIGMVAGDIYHLWHGELRDRGYLPRHAILARHEFDPYRDITLDGNGCWRWNSDKPGLHAAVEDYFRQRREDGREGEQSNDDSVNPRIDVRR